MTKQIRSNRREGERGATLILFTLLAVLVIIPIVGLAIDGAIVMWEKARLVASVDAAALAGGRSLNVLLSDADQQAPTSEIVDKYFNANFQPGQMGTAVIPNLDGKISCSLKTTTTPFRYRTVNVAKSISVPLFFMRILGFTQTTMEATGQASRRDVNIVLVLDRSGSIEQSHSCKPLIADAQYFVNLFADGQDQLALVTFQYTGKVDYEPNMRFKSSSPTLISTLDPLVCSGNTNSVEGLSLAYQLIQQSGRQGALNVVVFFSDGYPNGVTFGGSNKLPVITDAGIKGGQTDQRYGYPDYNTTSDTKPSGCSSAAMDGVLVAGSPTPSGPTEGVIDSTTLVPISSPPSGKVANVPGCAFSAKGSSYMRYDIAYVPPQDKYGNPTGVTLSPIGPHPFRPIDTFTYGGVTQIRPDTPKSIVNAAYISADNAAYKIRNDTTYNPVIYSIGLGSGVDDDFMERVANDRRASSYDSSKPAGLYIKAPTSAQLLSAFQQIASQVLRISQ